VSLTILFGVTVDQSLKLMRGQPQYLASRGWHVHVVSAGDSHHDPKFFLGTMTGVDHHSVPMVRTPAPMRDFFGLIQWWLLLRRVRPDVICLGTPKASLLGLLAGWCLSVPSRVYLIRGFRFESYGGLRRRLLVSVERVTARLATHVVAVSPSLLAVATAERVAAVSRLSVVGLGSSNGVRIPPYHGGAFPGSSRSIAKQALGLSSTVPIVGYVGRLTPDKGVLELANACVRLKRRGIDTQLLMVGAEDSVGYAEKIRAALDDGGLTYAIHSYAEQPSDIMSMMDVFCLPSVREGMPNVTLEAAALGLPVITTEATGCRDSLLPGITGLTYPVGDVHELTSALAKLIGDEALRMAMGQAGASWVAARFERGAVWRAYEHLYRESTRPPSRMCIREPTYRSSTETQEVTRMSASNGSQQ
jgi:glycosyltransferase involved in cell wall biosynthesis